MLAAAAAPSEADALGRAAGTMRAWSATARADLSRTWAIVPIRGLETAKTRLGEDLDAEERLELVTDLLPRDARRHPRRADGSRARSS